MIFFSRMRTSTEKHDRILNGPIGSVHHEVMAQKIQYLKNSTYFVLGP